MYILDSSTKLQAVLAGAKATNDCKVVCSWMEYTATGPTPGLTTISTNGTTAVDIAAAAASTEGRFIKNIQIENADTASITLTIRLNNAGTTTTIFKAAIAVGYTLVYEDGAGWNQYDTKGQLTTVAKTISGRFIRQLIFLNGFYYPSSNCKNVEVEMIGAGSGGGGGAAGGVGGVAGGGAGGGYLRKYISGITQTLLGTSFGSGGTGGVAATGATGGAGGATSFTINSIVLTCPAGVGGTGTGSSPSVPEVAAGGSGGIPTNGDLNVQGIPGNPGVMLANVSGQSFGGGGGSVYFIGGGGIDTKTAPGFGNIGGSNNGAAGGGAFSSTGTSASGASSSSGVLIIREYT